MLRAHGYYLVGRIQAKHQGTLAARRMPSEASLGPLLKVRVVSRRGVLSPTVGQGREPLARLSGSTLLVNARVRGGTKEHGARFKGAPFRKG